MMNRREVLKSLALSTGAAIAGAGALQLTKAAAQSRDSVAVPPARPDTLRSGGMPRDTTRQGSAPAATGAAPAGPFTLPPLPYPYDALEPYLDARTMQLHHDAHHAAYVANLNKAVAGKPDLGSMPLEQMLRSLDKLPDTVRSAVRNQGGGHANHSLLWASLSKSGPREPQGDLAKAINDTFGGFGAFQEKLKQAATGVFGSGWAWLSLDDKGALHVDWTQNQDTPLMAGRQPLLGVDVWEHAYYLKYQNRRAEYLDAFAKVVDWGVISGRYRDLKKG